MQWWNAFVDWLTSDDGWRILSTAVFPALAIVVAGLIAAMIGRGSTKRLITLHDREQRMSSVSALIGAARRASVWNTLSSPEQQHADHLAHDADISIRLLPLAGSTMTADWAAHKIADMKKDSVSFSFQAEQSLLDLRDRLVSWQDRPSRAKKLFKADLDLWAYESSQTDKGLVEQQQEWAKQQVAAETGPISTVAPASALPAVATSPAAAPATAPSIPGFPAAVPSPAEAEPVLSAPAQASFTTPAPAVTGELETPIIDDAGIETPRPVSAQTVRQRILPDGYEQDSSR